MAADAVDDLEDPGADRAATDVLVENHRAFLRFLERRVGNRALAEDLLQDAFVRHLDRLATVPAEGLVPWFYRVLRNAAIDRHRRRGAEGRALAAFGRELARRASATPGPPARDLHLCGAARHDAQAGVRGGAQGRGCR